MSDIEDAAIETVAGAVAAVPERVAMASALMRIAGNMLARLTNHERAWQQHAELARRHYERCAQSRKSGR